MGKMWFASASSILTRVLLRAAAPEALLLSQQDTVAD